MKGKKIVYMKHKKKKSGHRKMKIVMCKQYLVSNFGSLY